MEIEKHVTGETTTIERLLSDDHYVEPLRGQVFKLTCDGDDVRTFIDGIEQFPEMTDTCE